MDDEEGIYLIQLTRGMFARISVEDNFLARYNWQVHQGTAKSAKFYAAHGALGLMHRVIAVRMGWNIVDKHVHHIDGNGLNNVRDNLVAYSFREHGHRHASLRRLYF